jgi:hypothetical protein
VGPNKGPQAQWSVNGPGPRQLIYSEVDHQPQPLLRWDLKCTTTTTGQLPCVTFGYMQKVAPCATLDKGVGGSKLVENHPWPWEQAHWPVISFRDQIQIWGLEQSVLCREVITFMASFGGSWRFSCSNSLSVVVTASQM